MFSGGITQVQAQEIKQAVAQAEKSTSGEIVPYVTLQASHYSAGYYLLALLGVAVMTTIYFAVLKDHLSAGGLVLFQVIALMMVFILEKTFPGLKLWLIPKAEKQKRIDRAAFQVFYEEGLSHTRDRTGILIAVFLTEHTVRILADQGINDRVPKNTWDEVVQLITQTISAQGITQGVVVGVKRCGEILSKQFPIKPDDTNELKNDLRVG